MYFRKTMSKLFLISSCSYFCTRQQAFMSEQPMISQVIRGEYQNRIRRYSPPQKIFDVFATIREKGYLYMTINDLLKAICFYNFSVADQSQTQGYSPQHILELIGKKDKFQFYDYFILVRFLAFDKKKTDKYFQEVLHNKNMNKQAFKKFLMEAVCSDYNQFIKPSLGIQSRQFKPSLQNFQKSIDQTVQSIFTKRDKFTQQSLIQYRRTVIKQMFGFQFLMFKLEDNLIDGMDFARSIIKYVQSSKRRKYINRAKQFSQQFKNVKINMQSYVGFHYFMQTKIDDLANQLNTYGALNTQDAYQFVNKFQDQKNKVSKEQINIMVKILDIDDSGFIQKKQFLGVLENLTYYTQVKSGEQTLTELMLHDWNQIKIKAKKILQIIQQ